MDSNTAIAHIETYGADTAKWPKAIRADILNACKSDPAVAKARKEQKALDKALSEWQYASDGVEDVDADTGEGGGDGNSHEEAGSINGDSTTDSEDGEGGRGHGSDAYIPQADAKEEEAFVASDEDLANIKDVDAIMAEIVADAAIDDVDEWFTFTRDYDEYPVVESGNYSPERLDKIVQGATGALQKNLLRLMMARGRSFLTPGFRSGRLHNAALHRIVTGDDRLFRRKEQAKNVSTAVTLLMDCSGSMGAPAGGGKRRIDVAIESAYAISQVLSKIGIRNEVIGFTDIGSPNFKTREEATQFEKEVRACVDAGVTVHRAYPIIMPVLKTFAEGWSNIIAKRFATAYADSKRQLRLHGNTDGESLRLAAERLRKVDAERRILIVLSDGEPAANSPMSKDMRRVTYDGGAGDLMRSVKKLEKSGIEVLAFGMAHEGVKRYYSRYEVVNNVTELPVKLLKQLKDLLVR